MQRQVKKLARAAQLLARGQLRIVGPGDDEEEPEEQISEALAAFGLKATEDVEVEEVFELWPENVETFTLWRAIQTQWVTSMSGATGLNYAGVQVVMNRRGIPKKKQDAMFISVQAMEDAALSEWDSAKERRR